MSVENHTLMMTGHNSSTAEFVTVLYREFRDPHHHPMRRSQEISFENNHIIFYADGTIQAGTVYLVDVNKKLLYALTSGVGHISFLRKYRYDGSWHVI